MSAYRKIDYPDTVNVDGEEILIKAPHHEMINTLEYGLMTPEEYRERFMSKSTKENECCTDTKEDPETVFHMDDKGLTVKMQPNRNHSVLSPQYFDGIEAELAELKATMNRKLNITMLNGCRSCGAKVKVDIDRPVFCCPYCGTTYIIGAVQQNSTY